jgi:fucose permease
VPVSYTAFVLLGIGAGASGVLLPSQMAGYGVDRATIGISFFTISAGWVLAGMSSGALIHRFGIRIVLMTGGGAYMLSGLYLATRPPFVAFVLVQVLTGYGAGVLESALNVYLTSLPGATTLLNRLHAFWGAAAGHVDPRFRLLDSGLAGPGRGLRPAARGVSGDLPRGGSTPRYGER